MKKAEIKRRKRVVPAHQSGTNQTDAGYNDAMSDHSDQRATPDSHGPGPIPVDFTEAFRNRDDVGDIPKKRTFSASNDAEPYPHPQNLASSPAARDENLDPALPLPHRGSGGSKEDRRAELRKQAELMRQALLEKERELAELEDES